MNESEIHVKLQELEARIQALENKTVTEEPVPEV